METTRVALDVLNPFGLRRGRNGLNGQATSWNEKNSRAKGEQENEGQQTKGTAQPEIDQSR
jgi:hypothetical protein